MCHTVVNLMAAFESCEAPLYILPRCPRPQHGSWFVVPEYLGGHAWVTSGIRSLRFGTPPGKHLPGRVEAPGLNGGLFESYGVAW